jgi:hypothetical protein
MVPIGGIELRRGNPRPGGSPRSGSHLETQFIGPFIEIEHIVVGGRIENTRVGARNLGGQLVELHPRRQADGAGADVHVDAVGDEHILVDPVELEARPEDPLDPGGRVPGNSGVGHVAVRGRVKRLVAEPFVESPIANESFVERYPDGRGPPTEPHQCHANQQELGDAVPIAQVTRPHKCELP